MKVSFYNLGCKVNLADISRIGKQFEGLGHEIVDFEEKSDVVLINTCTVTHRADADCRKLVRKALRQSPEAFVGVLGCFAQLKPDEVVKIQGVDAVFGQNEKYKIPELIGDFTKRGKGGIFVGDASQAEFHTSAVSDNAGRTRAIFKIQDGCDYHCTFCTIPFARGKSRSMNFNEIESELVSFVNQGFKEVVLSGVNLGEYEATSGQRFIDVVKLIDSLQLDLRFRISSIEPNLLKKDVLEAVMSSKYFCKHFHIPLQSGSQDILMKMKRRYRAKNYATLINDIKSIDPNTCIGADVITGFPGETKAHFDETIDFIESLPISYLHAFTYSEREGTPAATMQEIIPHDERKNRTNMLRRLSDIKLNDFYESQIGNTQTLIAETRDENSGLWRGWTDNYVKCYFEADSDIAGQKVEVEMIENHATYVMAKAKENQNFTNISTKRKLPVLNLLTTV